MDCQPSLLDSGIPTIAWIANHLRFNWLTPILQQISNLGTEGGVILTLALAYWFWNKRYATYLGYALFTALLINLMIKGWVMECRPPKEYWLEIIHNNSFSFPSGHAQVATPLWIASAYYVRNKKLAILYCLLGLFITLSRPYLGVHFLHDVLVGASLGMGIYSLFIFAEKRNWQPLKALSFTKQALLLSLVLGAYILLLNQTSHSVIAAISSLVGFWFGCQCDTHWLTFTPPQTFRSRIALCFIGFAGILLIWKGLMMFSKASNPNIAFCLSIAQYSLLGAWITFAAPAIFSRLYRSAYA